MAGSDASSASLNCAANQGTETPTGAAPSSPLAGTKISIKESLLFRVGCTLCMVSVKHAPSDKPTCTAASIHRWSVVFFGIPPTRVYSSASIRR